jgi:hypothetical protein
MIYNYNDFLLESYLFASKYFIDVLKNINDDISNDLSKLIFNDVNTKYNALNITDKNDIISFIPDSQYNDKINQGINPIDLFSDSNNKTSVGRIVRKILKDNNKEYSDQELEAFVNKFKATWSKFKKTNDDIRLVSGEEIRFWYLQDNYNDDALAGYGTLGKSCMRFDECQFYFDIYVKNPDVCRLLIFTNDENELMARALVWETSKGKYLDRVYYTNPEEENLLNDWTENNLDCDLYWTNGSIPRFEVNLSVGGNFKFYPYLDSIPYYSPTSNKLYNYIADEPTLFFLQDDDGTYVDVSEVYCDYLDTYAKKSNCFWSNIHNSYLPMYLCLYSTYYNDFVFKDDVVYLASVDGYVLIDDVIKDEDGNYTLRED